MHMQTSCWVVIEVRDWRLSSVIMWQLVHFVREISRCLSTFSKNHHNTYSLIASDGCIREVHIEVLSVNYTVFHPHLSAEKPLTALIRYDYRNISVLALKLVESFDHIVDGNHSLISSS